MIASSSENDRVLNADFTTWIFLFSSAFSSCTERIISSPTTVVPYSLTMISSMSYPLVSLYLKSVPRRSPAISIGLIIAIYLLMSSPSKPSVCRFTFSFVDKTPRSLSFRSLSINPPTSSSISSVISSTPGQLPTPRTFPFLLITRILESRVSTITSQISLNNTLEELLLWSSLFIFLVLSNNCTLITNLLFHYFKQHPALAKFSYLFSILPHNYPKINV